MSADMLSITLYINTEKLFREGISILRKNRDILQHAICTAKRWQHSINHFLEAL